MRYLAVLFVVILAGSATLLAEGKIPNMALCSVCALKGGETKKEKVMAHSGYDGKRHYFCSNPCKKEFDLDPFAFLPPVFPRPAPAFVVESLDGNDMALADLKGKVVLVDFWATWCKPCLETMPKLQKLYNKYSGEAFEVLGVSIEEKKDRAKKVQ